MADGLFWTSTFVWGWAFLDCAFSSHCAWRASWIVKLLSTCVGAIKQGSTKLNYGMNMSFSQCNELITYLRLHFISQSGSTMFHWKDDILAHHEKIFFGLALDHWLWNSQSESCNPITCYFDCLQDPVEHVIGKFFLMPVFNKLLCGQKVRLLDLILHCTPEFHHGCVWKKCVLILI